MRKLIIGFVAIIMISLIVVVCWYKVNPEGQLGELFSLYLSNKDIFAPLEPYEVLPTCKDTDILTKQLVREESDNKTDNEADLVISNIKLIRKIPAYFKPGSDPVFDSNLVDECGLVYSDPKYKIEADKKGWNCQERQSQSIGVVATGSFVYDYIVTVKNIGTKSVFSAVVKYNPVNTVGYWDFGFKPWDDRYDPFLQECSDPIIPSAFFGSVGKKGDLSISKFAESICASSFCTKKEYLVPRDNYCALLTNLIRFKSVVDDIKRYIISSDDYKDNTKKIELDRYLNKFKEIYSIFKSCFSEKYGVQIIDKVGLQNTVCGLNISYLNSLMTRISLNINMFKGDDKSGLYKSVPIFSDIETKYSPVMFDKNNQNKSIDEEIKPGKEIGVSVLVQPPIIRNKSGGCQPDVGYWSVKTDSIEITKNNNYDISSNSTLPNDCTAPYVKSCSLDYYKTSILTGKGSEGQMYINTKDFPGLLGSYNDMGRCGEPAKYYTSQIGAHGHDFCADTFTFIAPHGTLPSIDCIYYWK